MKKNLLIDWYKDAFLISSPINIAPQVERKKIDFIYETLRSQFGEKYFEITIGHDTPIEKVSWMHSHLTNSKHLGSIGALNEIAEVIQYLKTLDSDIQKEFRQLLRNPQNLRSFFFELYIYKLLDRHNIANAKKVKSGNQIIEGVCNLFDEEYLFECRKVFMPKINELDIKRRLMVDVWKQSQSMKHGFPMICSIKLTHPINSSHRSSFAEKIKTFFNGFNKFKTLTKIDYEVKDLYGTFRAMNYDDSALIEEKDINKCDIIFYVKRSNNITGNSAHFQGHIECNFAVYSSTLYKKLESVLREKKSQHKLSPYRNKIIFLDNEIFPEFHMGLFQNENTFEIEKVKEIYDKLHLTDIVCILRRYYLEETPRVKVDIIHPRDKAPVARYLQTLISK